ncbi:MULTISPECIES: helix-turn-helix transcriptional regulator [unclassified Streptomyces]|uniref:helix-turn-helix domain-containing protein n=1 Tax=unclassified Streptomyces TaxID=2593676 RepID=UPI0023662D04|nr:MULTISPECIES: helix-turn-helix transcriptional regulator [unclassified Streptomyces]MDF3141632.1 helix-turn-helix transcriptional regulator [Streptomyces sp. T21Q-yed]WDF39341.1 helix-turn-helix transcriptional regulator [Streptomyces sp. T12]
MRSNPTGRQLRLGTELRKLRERAGLTAAEAGQLLGVKPNQISNMEAGRAGVSAERVRTVACNYDCSDTDLVKALVGMTGDRTRGWWEEYREILPSALLDLAEVEHHAMRLHTAITVHIPGLLQTTDHARELFRQVVPALSPPDIEHRVSFRIKRQAVVFRDSPAPYLALIHEAALRMEFGGPAIARAQLQHLLDMSEQDHITIKVLPFAAGGFPGSGQSIFYSSGPVPQLDTVHLDQSHGPAFLDAEAQLSKYRVLLDRMETKCLPAEKSRDLIRSIAHNL